ncbi:uncharacterized protein M6B38_186415 [Iris pallida]|uniref:Uncharacterized protein n=1 Tax=Iris pallida TaxID=29817 RepID=A0AAX6EJ86_IRIPA|nr:uncharacterized protein M6B38_186415 [Iris pallida]
MEAPWKDLEGKVVLVTGASAGIGRGLCLDLARAGCRVVAAARRTDRLESLCEEINGPPASRPVRSAAVEIDVSAGEARIEEAVRTAWSKFGTIDAVVNNAGVRGGVYSPLDWSEEEWQNVMGTNLTGLWLVTKHVCRTHERCKRKRFSGQHFVHWWSQSWTVTWRSCLHCIKSRCKCHYQGYGIGAGCL